MPAYTRQEKIARFSFSTSQRFDPDNPPNFGISKKELNRVLQKGKDIFLIQSSNGISTSLDRKFRALVAEYNHRVILGRGDQMPSSFNITNQFLEPDSEALILNILPERHFSVGIEPLIEYLSRPDSDTDFGRLSALPEAVVFHTSLTGDFARLSWPDRPDMSFFGASFIRNGTDVSIFSLFAQKVAPSETAIENLPVDQLHPERNFLRARGDTVDARFIPFEGNAEYFPLMLLCKVDIQSAELLTRYVLEERQDVYQVATDDLRVLEGIRQTFGVDHGQRQRDTLDSFGMMFNMIAQTPLFVEQLRDSESLKVVRQPTDLASLKGGKLAKAQQRLGRDFCPNYRNVETLYSLPDSAVGMYHLPASSLRFEKQGHWKSLPLGAAGEGRNGDVLVGRTWVSVTKEWHETTVEWSTLQPSSVRVVPDAEVGYVYVLRNPQHPANFYKVGYTLGDPEDRARSLSDTGQPDNFGVMQSWKVRAPKTLEALVHAALAKYRVKQSREFFCVRYAIIREAVEDEMRKLGIEELKD